LAVLTIDDRKLVSYVDPCLIAQADPGPDTSFSCQGFPPGYPNGALAEGHSQAVDAGGWIDAVADAAFGHFIEPGFSGAPVFGGHGASVCPGEVIGLCVTADAGGKRVARLIPPGHLAHAVRAVASPYRWLEHFSDRDVAYFFGRKDLTAELWDDLKKQRFVLLAGPVGSGKSSLVGAGLVASARREEVDAVVMRPLAHARAELARALGLPADPPADDDAILDKIRSRPASKGLLLAVDQAEELTHGKNREQAGQFLQLLADLLGECSELRIVLAARSDELPALLAAQPRTRLLEKNLRYIDELGREELRWAIARPAERLRVNFAPGLVTLIVNDAVKSRVPLPILQLCLSRLWENRETKTIPETIPEHVYRELGGLTGALASHAKSVMEQIHAEAEKLPFLARSILKSHLGLGMIGLGILGRLFLGNSNDDPEQSLSEGIDRVYRAVILQFVEVGDKGEDARRRVRTSDLNPLEKWLAQQLRKGRLLVVSSDAASGEDMMELAHDSLLTKWTPLSNLIEARRDHLRLRSQLQREAAYWNMRGRPARYRWSDERALEVAGMMREMSHHLSDVEQLFLGPVDRPTMLETLGDANTTHSVRATIGTRLALLGDTRPGTGIENGLPDIVWCPVPAGRVMISDVGEYNVDAFAIAKYPVTYAQYRQFLESPDGYRDDHWWNELSKRYYEEPGRQIPLLDNHPAVNVDWMEAVAYCRWLTRRLQKTVRLPAEWEWQLAATQGDPTFEFPWGPNWDENRANTYENKLNFTVAVGLYPQGLPDNAPLDLAGNIWEWCINTHHDPRPVPETSFGGTESRAIRGGASSSTAKYARTSFRNRYRPDYRFDALGFRLVCATPQ
jgi:energy-coupling factor transporter ATP-binding protein EcfA2